MKLEDQTLLIRKAINILFVSNPRGTSIGVLLGAILDGVLGLFGPYLKSLELIDILAVKTWHLVALGIASMNIPAFLKRDEIDPSIVNALNFIEERSETLGLPEWQVRAMYNDLFNEVLDSVSLNEKDDSTANKIKSITRGIDKN